MGAVYPDVPSVILPQSPSGTAQFYYDLKPFVLRPDAEIVQTWSADYLANGTKGITIPAYSTTATTLYTGQALTPTVTISNANYRYFVMERFLTIPQYSVTSKAAGRQEYTFMSAGYEIGNFSANVFQALVDTTKYTSRNCAVFAAGNIIRCLYWSSASALKVYTANTYGVAQTITAPAVSSGTAASPTLTVTEPTLQIRGSTSYLASTYYNAITDIRAQYVIELYRCPVNTDSRKVSGWGNYSQAMHILDCTKTANRKLT